MKPSACSSQQAVIDNSTYAPSDALTMEPTEKSLEMKKVEASIRLSASDLSNHLACRHLTALDLNVADGGRPAPAWNSPDTQIPAGAGYRP